MKVLSNGILYESKEKYELTGINGKVRTNIPPEKRSLKNLPRYSTGKSKIRFQDWLEMENIIDNSVAKGCDGKWYGWSHRAVYGFTIGDKVKKGDVAYKGREYTIKSEDEAKQTAKVFADEIS